MPTGQNDLPRGIKRAIDEERWERGETTRILASRSERNADATAKLQNELSQLTNTWVVLSGLASICRLLSGRGFPNWESQSRLLHDELVEVTLAKVHAHDAGCWDLQVCNTKGQEFGICILKVTFLAPAGAPEPSTTAEAVLTEG